MTGATSPHVSIINNHAWESWLLEIRKESGVFLTMFPICLKGERYEKRAVNPALSNRLLSVSKIVAFALEVFR